MADYESWGRYFHYTHSARRPEWRDVDFSFIGDFKGTALPRGFGRSYGDVCLNDRGLLIESTALNRFISFDRAEGVIRCESGVSLAEILELAVPSGWFPPVLPGTKFVTVGGAIGNDVHGKNHHRAGSFGRYVNRFELIRSDGSRMICSPSENAGLYRATIGGLGLTGFITWAEIGLRKISSPMVEVESIKYPNLDAFFELNEESEKTHEYTVAWVDCLATGSELGRGIYMRANHVDPPTGMKPGPERSLRPRISIPVSLPNFTLNKYSIKAFNYLYSAKQRDEKTCRVVHYNSFFTPLDAIGEWNRIYGRRGFFQYQFVMPTDRPAAIREVFELIARSGQASFLVVLKTFGEIQSPGIMSFARPGVTLALDFPNRGAVTMELFERLNRIVLENDGRLNPSKDAVMTPELFASGFPARAEFEEYRDPGFSSSFWRRVTNDE